MGKIRGTLVWLTVLVLWQGVSVALIRVPQDQPTVQAALDWAQELDTVLVDTGTYVENLDPGGKNLLLASHYLWENDTSLIHSTILDGGGQESVIRYIHQEDSTSRLLGFTIRGGSAARGGGVLCVGGSPRLEHLRVVGNVALQSGGGLACVAASPHLVDVELSDNEAEQYGGGIYINSPVARPVFHTTLVRENEAADGGGVAVHNGLTLLSGLHVRANQAGRGGGIFCYLSDVTVAGLLVVENRAQEEGGGIFCSTSTLEAEFLTLALNEAAVGAGLDADEESGVSLENSILWDDFAHELRVPPDALLEWCDIFGGWPGAGNLDLDPRFCDPPAGDYSLAENSPCLGAGSGGVDMGALPGAGCPPQEDEWNGPCWWVGPEGSDVLGSGAPDAPWASIQYALTHTAPGDTVVLLDGTYGETVDFGGRAVTVGSRYLLDGDTLHVLSTILQGTGNSSVVLFHNGETEASALVGVTITGGGGESGGGVECRNSGPRLERLYITGNGAVLGAGVALRENSSPLLQRVEIRDNQAVWWGGGIFCGEESEPRIEESLVADNTAVYGGGLVFWEGSRPELDGVTIRDNFADLAGGGVFSGAGADPRLFGCAISGNQAGTDGGGGYFDGEANPVVQFCLVQGNSAEAAGGGIYAAHNCILEVDQVTFYGNTAQEEGGALFLREGAVAGIVNTIFWEDVPQEIACGASGAFVTLVFSCSDLAGGSEAILTHDHAVVDWLTDNLDVDPQFCNPEDRDWRLVETSPCRTENCGFMGFTGETCSGEGLPECTAAPATPLLLDCYPNPFNPEITLEFSLAQPATTEILIYDLRGRLVDRPLTPTFLTPGIYRVPFSAGSASGKAGKTLASGVYLVVLKSAGMGESVTLTRKIVLLR